ncbi:MAG: class IV adenylate cyclase [Nocardiopsaceae bacterium]|nr:class IV adenylate cyclase [Nocardiopsaceae bacterium]
MSLVEIERKRALSSQGALRARLGELGFATTGSMAEVDTYYSRPDIDFRETVECLRVRQRDGRCEVTYKPASNPSTHSVAGVIAKEETNVELADADQAAHANRLLEVLGMVFLARVEKSRTHYRNPRQPELTVVLDTVTGVGTFVETEIVSAWPREEVIRRLDEIECRLGLDSCPVVSLPYRDLVLQC